MAKLYRVLHNDYGYYNFELQRFDFTFRDLSSDYYTNSRDEAEYIRDQYPHVTLLVEVS